MNSDVIGSTAKSSIPVGAGAAHTPQLLMSGFDSLYLSYSLDKRTSKLDFPDLSSAEREERAS